MKNGKIFLNVFVALGLVLVILITGGFVKETCRYFIIGEEIREIEKEGRNVIYNKNGITCGWDVYPDLKEQYDEKINDRKELIKSSDVASWLSSSSSTVTGKVIRVLAFLASIFTFISVSYFLYRLLLQDLGYLLEALRIKWCGVLLIISNKNKPHTYNLLKTICVRLLWLY